MFAPTSPMLKLRFTSGTTHSRDRDVASRRIQWSQCSFGHAALSSSTHNSRRIIHPSPGKYPVRRSRSGSDARLAAPLSFQLETHHSVGSRSSKTAVRLKYDTKSGLRRMSSSTMITCECEPPVDPRPASNARSIAHLYCCASHAWPGWPYPS